MLCIGDMGRGHEATWRQQCGQQSLSAGSPAVALVSLMPPTLPRRCSSVAGTLNPAAIASHALQPPSICHSTVQGVLGTSASVHSHCVFPVVQGDGKSSESHVTSNSCSRCETVEI